MRAVVLLSGGLDSATVLAMAKEDGCTCHALSFDYNQRHKVELTAAKRIAIREEIPHFIATIPDLGGSALTGDFAVPKHATVDEVDSTHIPLTYVPGRNTIFVAYALSLAERVEADRIYLGINALDYSGYPDCRPEWVHAMEVVAGLSSKRAVEGHRPSLYAPLVHMTKRDIVAEGVRLGVDYSGTHSCYDPQPGDTSETVLACGRCDSCLLRLAAFAENGLEDPIPYAKGPQ